MAEAKEFVRRALTERDEVMRQGRSSELHRVTVHLSIGDDNKCRMDLELFALPNLVSCAGTSPELPRSRLAPKRFKIKKVDICVGGVFNHFASGLPETKCQKAVHESRRAQLVWSILGANLFLL